MKSFAIHQFHPAIEEATAVSNEVLALREMFRDFGYRSEIFTSVPSSLGGAGIREWRDYSATEGDLLLVHYSLGSPAFASVFSAPGRKVIFYHGVTPDRFLTGLPSIRSRAEQGANDLEKYVLSVQASIAHSNFTGQDLYRAGYKGVDVLPYLLWERLYAAPESTTPQVNRTGDRKNLLVVGRLMPHKRLEESLFVLDYLRNRIGSDWNLIVAGSWDGAEAYRDRLLSLAEKMKLSDIQWKGQVSQASLIALYRAADALLLLSAHEGFGVPLVEAMRYDVPVFARRDAAVPEILEDAGVLFETPNWALIAESIHLVRQDSGLREKILTAQRIRRDFFSYAHSVVRWQRWLEKFS